MSKKYRGPAVQEERRLAAEARQRLRNELTPAEQIERLDARLGAGIGAKRERARLHEQLIAEKGGDEEQ